MKAYQRTNNIIGWIVFAIATLVYFLTVEPTASWWDCGEYIATSFKLQVGHPPGAPTFQLLGRFFSLFAFGDTSKVALMVNLMSALSSSFTVLFIFWSITMLAKKIALLKGSLTLSSTCAIMGSGIVGALALTFADSFWFSAAEGEVYAMSSFFTALVFWAMLKWETVADQKHSNRWILLISLLMGLSIGVHLLNLLTIPSLAFIYYFKKYKPSRKGVIYTAILGISLLGAVMSILIPWIVKLSSLFELFFVNNFGLPFNSGTLIYFLLIGAGIIYGLILTHRRKKILANTIILAFTFILIGYTSFVMLVIRSNANTPIDENDPEEAVSLLSYLNREQYGTWPILSGQYYNAPVVDAKAGNPVWARDVKTKKYIIVDDREGTEPVYDKRFTTFFPRMWSSQKQGHIRNYQEWGGKGGIPMQVQNRNGESETRLRPTFGQNLKFFFTYQLGHMYFRYFMWNFAGRQNDIEGHGGFLNGNWISGIPFMDEARLGPQDKLPQSMQNPAHNKFYFLPLLLGLAGLFYHINKHSRDSLIVGLLFFMTGIAIIIYLNQTPEQPRERDYSYAGSIMVFCIWIGLGVMALWDWLGSALRKLDNWILALGVTFLCLILVPGIMGQQGWDDHDRSGKYACRDFAKNYLSSCAPNAVLITNGDNDTFPLWYAQEVEGYRTDIRVVNYMLSSGDWYVHHLFMKMYDSEPLPFTIPYEKYDKGVNDVIYYKDLGYQGFTDLKTIIEDIKNEKPENLATLDNGKTISVLPTKNISLTVDTLKVVRNGLVPKALQKKIVPRIDWTIKRDYLLKNDIMLLDFLASNNWERPLYFTNPYSVNDLFDIARYCHLEGFLFKFLPVTAENPLEGMTEVSYDIMMNKSQWGNLDKPDVTVDRESFRNAYTPRRMFLQLAQQLINENKKDSAIKVMDRCQEILPNNKIVFDPDMVGFVDLYFKAGANDKAGKLADLLYGIFEENLNFYQRQKSKYAKTIQKEIQQDVEGMVYLQQLSERYKQPALTKKVQAYFAAHPQLMQQ